MASEFRILSHSKDGWILHADCINMPVSFVNGLRRIMLRGLPTVCIRDVQILTNTTQLPHEVLHHRMELLPVAVLPDETRIIRDAVVECKVLPTTTDRLIFTSDFEVEQGRDGVLMNDRDLGTPLLFARVRANEALHMRGRLMIDTERASQVCTATLSFHVDDALVKQKREEFIQSGQDVRIFDNSLAQRLVSRDERGRPNWIDLHIESVGVMKAKDCLHQACLLLRTRVDRWIADALERIGRDQEANSYRITMETGDHTIGALLQEVIYQNEAVTFVSYDIPHPLQPTLVLRFHTQATPESVLKEANKMIHEYCDHVEQAK
jgi:DNA-directed RNA polymerase subunit L